MPIARLRLGIFGTLRTQLVVTVTLALAAVAIPHADAAVKANGTATGAIVSTTTVSSNVNPSLTGQTVTFTASVTGTPITTFTNATIDQPTDITVGPDGALWFGNYGNNSIGRITTAGVVTNYPDLGISRPYAIAAGPDGNLWFTSHDNSKIGRITTAGVITLYSDATKIAGPYDIAAGSDGALWFTNSGIGGQYITKRSIGRITTAGAVSYYPAPGGSPWSCPGPTDLVCEPTGIAAGPDSALWFTNSGTHSIGRINTNGALSEYGGTGVSTPLYITAGPDGAMWFTNAGNNSIGRIDPTSHVITNYTSGTISGPRFITTGPDGNVWFANGVGDSIGRITPAGVVTSYGNVAAGVDGPDGIVAGPDGAIWFTNFDGDSIGRIAIGPGGTATGTVQFRIDGVDVGSPVALNGAAQAQVDVSNLAAGSHTISAVYSGDATFASSTSAPLTQVVTPGSTVPAQPDGRIRRGSTGPILGDNIYNTSGLSQSVTGSASTGRTVKFTISVQNDAASGADSFKVLATGTASAMYTVTYRHGTTNITAAVVAGTFTTPSLGPGAVYVITVKVRVNTSATAGSSTTRLVTVTSVRDNTKRDAVSFTGQRR